MPTYTPDKFDSLFVTVYCVNTNIGIYRVHRLFELLLLLLAPIIDRQFAILRVHEDVHNLIQTVFQPLFYKALCVLQVLL